MKIDYEPMFKALEVQDGTREAVLVRAAHEAGIRMGISMAAQKAEEVLFGLDMDVPKSGAVITSIKFLQRKVGRD